MQRLNAYDLPWRQQLAEALENDRKPWIMPEHFEQTFDMTMQESIKLAAGILANLAESGQFEPDGGIN